MKFDLVSFELYAYLNVYIKNLFFCGFLLPFHFMWCVAVWNLTVKMYSVNLTVMLLLQWSLKIKVLQLFLQACRGVHMCIFYEPHQQGESSPCGISSCLILYSISISSDLAVWVVTCHWNLDCVSLMSNSCLLSTLISLWGILLLNRLLLTDFWVLKAWGSNWCCLSCTYSFQHLIWKYLILTFIDGNLPLGEFSLTTFYFFFFW